MTPANVFELFDRAGALLGWPGCATPPAAAADAPAGPQPDCSLDGWLAQKGIPPAIRDDGAGGDFRRAVATRLTWLEHEAIRAAFLADPAGGPESPWPGDEALAAGLEGTPDDQIPWVAIERYGLPMSRPQRFGPFITQRFQRVALQLWLDEVPGMPKPGTVTPVLAGELLREAGLIPAGALVPITADGAPGEGPALPAPPPPGGWPPTPTPAPTAASIQPTPTPASPQPTPTRAATQTPPTATPTRAATSPPAAPATQR
ncbi:MAG: hypothetical protein ACRDI2_02655 [Chloroflexota bacterium]